MASFGVVGMHYTERRSTGAGAPAGGSPSSTVRAVDPAAAAAPARDQECCVSVSIWTVVAGFLDPWETRALGRVCRDCHLATFRKLAHATSGFRVLTGMGASGVRGEERAAAVEQGLGLLRTVGFLDDTADKLAQFVVKATEEDRRLPSVALCYMLTPMRWPQLSSDDAWHAALPFMDAYLAHFDFSGVSITQAMRHVMHFTGIPQSTRSMTLLLRRLAKRYFVSAVEPVTPRAFPDREMVYLCMYSAVILNGDLRNPAIRPAWKMTRQRFVANNLVVVPGVTEACLGAVYDDIAAHGLPVRGWEGEDGEAAARGGAGRTSAALRTMAATPPVRALCAAFNSVSSVVSAGAADVLRGLRGLL